MIGNQEITHTQNDEIRNLLAFMTIELRGRNLKIKLDENGNDHTSTKPQQKATLDP